MTHPEPKRSGPASPTSSAEISPELVLVDPVLRRRALRELPDEPHAEHARADEAPPVALRSGSRRVRKARPRRAALIAAGCATVAIGVVASSAPSAGRDGETTSDRGFAQSDGETASDRGPARSDQGAIGRVGRVPTSRRVHHPRSTGQARQTHARRTHRGRAHVSARHSVATTRSAAKSRATRGSGIRGRVFAWQPVPRATYYTVRLYRGAEKIFQASVSRTRVRVPGSWIFERRAERLVPGIYQWSVRPGYGPRSRSRYGGAVLRANLTITLAATNAQR